MNSVVAVIHKNKLNAAGNNERIVDLCPKGCMLFSAFPTILWNVSILGVCTSYRCFEDLPIAKVTTTILSHTGTLQVRL